MLPAAIQEKMTPKRKRQGLYVLLAALLYSLLGFLAAPYLVEKLLKDFVADKLKLEATVSKVELNPWIMAVRLNDLKIVVPKGGETLIAAKSIYVNLDMLTSIWIRGAALDELDLQALYVNAHINKSGDLNLLKLVPPSNPKDKSSANWKVAKFGLHNGHIDFRDETRPTTFNSVFSPLNLALENLSSQPNKDGEYQLAAETGHGEKLRWHGTLALKPVRSTGHLDVENLQATTPWSYVQDSVPVIVKTGLVSIAGDYRLTVDQTVNFKLDQGQIRVNNLAMQQKTATDPLLFSLNKIELNGLQLDWPLHAVNVQSLNLGDFAIVGTPAKEALVKFQGLSLQQITWQAQGQVAGLKRIELDQLALHDEKDQPLLNLPALILDELQAQVPEQLFHVEHITLNGGDANVRVLPGNKVNWQSAIETLSKRLLAMAPPPDKNAEKTASPPWSFALGQLELNKFAVSATDERFNPAVKIPVQDINMHIQPRTAPDRPHVLDGSFVLGFGGKVGINGALSESPVDADVKLKVQDLNIPPLAPYFADIGRFELKSGQLDVDGRFKFHQGKQAQASFDGRVAVNRFAANDLDMDQRFMAWKQLAADGLRWNLAPMTISIKQVLADEPYSRLIITPDYKLNLQHIFANAKTNTVDNKPVVKNADSAMMPVKVDRVLVKNGSMLFADFTLKPQFATGIQALNGDIQGISTNKDSRAKINLSGRVDQYGTALITGEISPLATDKYSDVSFKFDNLELTTMTPYSAKFAGYRIDQGKLSLDLNYKINNRQLQATNKVVLNQLKLGDKVDSPDAVNLPLRLAVAILKDSNGVINIDLPVTGSMDDPKFRVGPIIWQAFVNLLTKAATAPFKFIAGLVGGGDDMDSIAFDPGANTIRPDQVDKLKKLAQAVQRRPSLRLELRGAYDKQADQLALKTVKFNAAFQKQLAGGGKERKLLESLFKEKVGKEALEEQKALNLKPPADNDPNPKATLALSEQAYVKSLRNELIAREMVTDGEMRQLALDRANAMRSQLVEQDQLNAAQIFVLEPEMVTAVNNQVICKLGLNAG